MILKIATLVAAVNGAPTLATDGFPLHGAQTSWEKNFDEINDAQVCVHAVGTSTGALAFTGFLWGYSKDLALWQRWKALNAAAGALTTAQSVAATALNKLDYAEGVQGFRHFDRIYLEFTAVAGTTPQLDAYLLARKAIDWSK